MGYNIKYDALDAFNGTIKDNYNAWAESLGQVIESVAALITSSSMAGQTADNIKLYLQNVHSPTLNSLLELAYLHLSNCLIYKTDYQSKIDGDLHAVIDEQELIDDNENLKTRKATAVAVDTELFSYITDLKDILEISVKNIETVAACYDEALFEITDLQERIAQLEDAHFTNDFQETGPMIEALKKFIQEQLGTDRSYKTDYSDAQLLESGAYNELRDAYLAVNQENQDQTDAMKTAMAVETHHLQALAQEEYEKRKAIADGVKIGATIVIAVAAVVVSVATFGSATGVAAMGAAALIGGVSTGATTLICGYADQYALYGDNMDQFEHGKVWAKAGLFAVGGAAGGFLGAGVSQGMSAVCNSTLNSITSTATVQTFSETTKQFINIGGHVVVGSVSEVSSGMVTRGTETFITSGGDIEAAFRDATNAQEMTLDAALGAAGEVFDTMRSNKALQGEVDKYTKLDNMGIDNDPTRNGHNVQKRLQDAGFTDVELTSTGGADFKNSSSIYRDSAGNPCQARAKVTDDKIRNIANVEEVMKKKGINVDFSAEKGSGNGAWFIMDDFDVSTGEATFQFVKKDALNAIDQMGGKGQYNLTKGILNADSKQQLDNFHRDLSKATKRTMLTNGLYNTSMTKMGSAVFDSGEIANSKPNTMTVESADSQYSYVSNSGVPSLEELMAMS